MDTLLIGNCSILSQKSIRKIFVTGKDDVCIVCSDDYPESRSGRVRYLHTPTGMHGYDFLFERNHFDNVIYLSEFLTPNRTPFHEVENLGSALAAVSSHAGKAGHMIYVIPSIDLQRKGDGKDEDFAPLCISAALSLFNRYRRNLTGKTSFAILRTPYVTGSLENGDFLSHVFQAADEKKELALPWPEYAQLPLVHEEDLREFFIRFLDLWDGSDVDMTLNPGMEPDQHDTEVRVFAAKLQEVTGCKVRTAQDTDTPPLVLVDARNNTARTEYGWYAKIGISEQLPLLHNQYELAHPDIEKHILPALHIPRKILTLIELGVGTVLTQFLIYISGSSVQFRMIDYRLLFVVIMSTMYGSRVGFFSAFIMSCSLFYAYAGNGISGTMLLYDPGNWIPFIMLFGVGAVCGYTRQSMRDRISVLEKDREDLTQENAAINGLYDDAARSRDNYRQDLMMSQNSFGEIFEVVQKLNSLHPDAIYGNAVPIFEEILETNSIAIYDISDKNAAFARLEVCSNAVKETYPRSIRLSDFPEVTTTLQNGELWINKKATPHLPAYIAGVTDEDGHLAIAVIIGGIPFERMTGYYANIVRVLAGIMQSFLLRAFHYTRSQKERYYYPGTILMHEDVFAARFRQTKEAARGGITSWRLLQIDGGGKSVKEWDSLLSGKVRTTDAICYGSDGNIYLLLNQVDEKTESIVLRRYQEYGFSCRYVKDLPTSGKEKKEQAT